MANSSVNVSNVTAKILYKLTSDLSSSSSKAQIANLRNSIGKPVSQTIDIWPIIFEYFPQEFLGKDKVLSFEEKAILNTLQLFALYQKGVSESAYKYNEESIPFANIGKSLSNLRTGDDIKAVDRRFNAMITSTTYEELIYHLRQMIKLLKSKLKTDVFINFPELTNDLYWYLRGYEENVKLKWAKSYYSSNMKLEGDNHDDQ